MWIYNWEKATEVYLYLGTFKCCFVTVMMRLCEGKCQMIRNAIFFFTRHSHWNLWFIYFSVKLKILFKTSVPMSNRWQIGDRVRGITFQLCFDTVEYKPQMVLQVICTMAGLYINFLLSVYLIWIYALLNDDMSPIEQVTAVREENRTMTLTC